MNYIKNLIKAIVPVIIYLVLSYVVILGSCFVYYLLGYKDIEGVVINYASYILVIFNIIYIYVLLKRNNIFIKKSKYIIPLFMLGISYACFGNMLILYINTNDVVNMNIIFLILSSVIVGPIIEEIIFRYILINKLNSFNNRFISIVISSIIFALAHNGIINIIYTFILGMILGIIYIKDKNLLNSIVLHSSANLISLFLYSYNPYIMLVSFVLLIISISIIKREYLKI